MITNSLLRRALVGLAVFASMIVIGVMLAAGGDQNTRRPPAARLTAVNAVGSERARRHAADATRPRPNPRAPKRTGSRSNPL